MTPSTWTLPGRRAAALAIVATLALAACSAAATPAPTPAPSAAATTSADLDISSSGYSQVELTVEEGTTVTWTNRDADTHTVTGTNGATFDSGNLASGTSFQQTFSTAGTYTYMCVIHTEMTGTITVTASAASSATASPAQ